MITRKQGEEEMNYPEEKLVNDHCYLYCPKLGQRRNTKCCIATCADKGRKFSDAWKDKKRNSCTPFQLWLPKELRATLKVDKRKKKKKNAKVQTVVSTKNISVSLKDLKTEGRGRPSKEELMNASSCAVKYMGETSCSAKKAAEYVSKHCRLSVESILKNIGRVSC